MGWRFTESVWPGQNVGSIQRDRGSDGSRIRGEPLAGLADVLSDSLIPRWARLRRSHPPARTLGPAQGDVGSSVSATARQRLRAPSFSVSVGNVAWVVWQALTKGAVHGLAPLEG